MKLQHCAIIATLVAIPLQALAQNAGLKAMEEHNKSYFKHHKSTGSRSAVKLPKMRTHKLKL